LPNNVCQLESAFDIQDANKTHSKTIIPVLHCTVEFSPSSDRVELLIIVAYRCDVSNHHCRHQVNTSTHLTVKIKKNYHRSSECQSMQLQQ